MTNKELAKEEVLKLRELGYNGKIDLRKFKNGDYKFIFTEEDFYYEKYAKDMWACYPETEDLTVDGWENFGEMNYACRISQTMHFVEIYYKKSE